MSLTNYLEQNETIPNHIKKSILVDVSRGLLYLHTQDPPIIHRNITANNVLLTSDMTAKITDFGESCMFDPDPTKYYNRKSKYSRLLVYIPRKALESDYEDKLDVFSFGVLILHVYTQQWPEPTPLSDNRTEVQSRQYLLDKVNDDMLKKLAEECLHEDPHSRPHALDLSRRITGIFNK